jgi:hypothetical protein
MPSKSTIVPESASMWRLPILRRTVMMGLVALGVAFPWAVTPRTALAQGSVYDAAVAGDLETVRTLIAAKADLAEEGDLGTPLHVAALKDNAAFPGSFRTSQGKPCHGTNLHRHGRTTQPPQWHIFPAPLSVAKVLSIGFVVLMCFQCSAGAA